MDDSSWVLSASDEVAHLVREVEQVGAGRSGLVRTLCGKTIMAGSLLVDSSRHCADCVAHQGGAVAPRQRETDLTVLLQRYAG